MSSAFTPETDGEGRRLSSSDDDDDNIVRAPQPAPKRRRPADVPETSSKLNGTGEVNASMVHREKPFEDIDDDRFFIRARTAKQSQRLQALIESRTSVPRGSPSLDVPCIIAKEPESGATSHAKKRQRSRSMSEGIQRQMPYGSGSDDVVPISSDDSEIEEGDPTKRSKVMRTNETGLRTLSRSPSLTPPPAPTAEDLYQLSSEFGIPKPVVEPLAAPGLFEPPSPEISFHVPEPSLNPDLQLYAEQARRQAARQRAEIEKITIKLQPVGDPRLDRNLDYVNAHLKEYEKSMKFIMNSTDNFEKVCQHFADRKGTCQGNVVLEYEGVEVFKSSTPASLGIKDRATMQAYSITAYEHVQAARTQERLRRIEELEMQARIEENGSIEAGSPQRSVNVDLQEAGSDGLRIILASQDGVTVKLQVRKSTKISAIISAYKSKRQELPSNTNVRIEFDGEVLPPDGTLGHTDLEDGDVLHVLTT